jgi:hypothetical protein
MRVIFEQAPKSIMTWTFPTHSWIVSSLQEAWRKSPRGLLGMSSNFKRSGIKRLAIRWLRHGTNNINRSFSIEADVVEGTYIFRRLVHACYERDISRISAQALFKLHGLALSIKRDKRNFRLISQSSKGLTLSSLFASLMNIKSLRGYDAASKQNISKWIISTNNCCIICTLGGFDIPISTAQPRTSARAIHRALAA